MPRREIWKDGLLAIAVTAISIELYHLAGLILDAAVSDSFLSNFLAQLVFAILVLS